MFIGSPARLDQGKTRGTHTGVAVMNAATHLPVCLNLHTGKLGQVNVFFFYLNWLEDGIIVGVICIDNWS